MKVLFLDLETTGTSPRYHSILEVAAVVVGPSLEPEASFQCAVFCPQARLFGEMTEHVKNMHLGSGLVDDVERSTFDVRRADEALYEFTYRHFPDGNVQLAGNSVHFDLSFIKEHMPRTAALLSHRIMDVSGMERQLQFLGIKVHRPGGTIKHRAMPDVLYSIEQMKLVREHLRGEASE